MQRLFAALLATLVVSIASATDKAVKASPSSAPIKEGANCQGEGKVNDLLAARPLICTSGKWRSVVFKYASDDAAPPMYYEGKCSLRFEEGKEKKGTVVVKVGDLADICLPSGWKIVYGAATNSFYWEFKYPRSIPNVVLLSSSIPSAASTFWIYPVNKAGELIEKYEIELQSTK
jgi:hypothetical protein